MGQPGTTARPAPASCRVLRGLFALGPSPEPRGASPPPDSTPAGSFSSPPQGKAPPVSQCGASLGTSSCRASCPPPVGLCGDGSPAPLWRQPWRDTVHTTLV